MTKRVDLVKEVIEAGLVSKGGTKHEKFSKPGFVTRIPYHREIDDKLANAIRKQAGIK